MMVGVLPRLSGFFALLGNVVVLFGPAPSWLVATVAAASLTVLVAILWWRPRWRSPETILALVVFCAAGVTAFCVLDRQERRWPSEAAGERVIAEVTIDSLPTREGGVLRFDADVVIETPATYRRVLRAGLNWRDPPRPMPRAGERWRVMLRLDPIVSSNNPGAANAERAALRDRIDATGSVVSWSATRREASRAPGVLEWRQTMAESIAAAVEDRDAAALFQGLAVGATGEITREQWRVFSVTGTTHLVAISGMHVTLFAWLAAFAARALWRRFSMLQQQIDREVFAAAVGVPAALGYAVLAGFGIPTQRTVVMLAVWWMLRLSAREQRGYEILATALLCVLLLDPFASYSAGFWLSFIAMAILLSVDETAAAGGFSWGGLRALVQTAWRVQWRVTIALIPLTAWWFASVSFASVPVNLFAIPIFSFLLVPLVLLGLAVQAISASIAAPLWRMVEAVHEIIWPPMLWIANQSWAAMDWQPSRPQFLILLVMAVVLLSSLTWRWRATIAVIGTLAIWPSSEIPQGAARITILDAGDAHAALIETRQHLVVYDTGESYFSAGRSAETLVWPAILAQSRSTADLLVLGASHGFRAEGAARLAYLARIPTVIYGGAWPGAPASHHRCHRTRRWTFDGVQFETFAAAGGSCLLRVSVREGGALLIAERVDVKEAAMLAADPGTRARLKATHVIAPRRGSLAAVTADFVAAVGATAVIVASAELPPARLAGVAARWQIPPIAVQATAVQGATRLELEPGRPGRLAAL
jgi:competence protein ComEC